MLNYEKIRTMPTTRDGKMAYGLLAALVARVMVNQGVALMPSNSDGALMAFLMAGVLVFTLVLAMVRYDTGRPLFEPMTRR